MAEKSYQVDGRRVTFVKEEEGNDQGEIPRCDIGSRTETWSIVVILRASPAFAGLVQGTSAKKIGIICRPACPDVSYDAIPSYKHHAEQMESEAFLFHES